MNTPIYLQFLSKLYSKYEINPNAIQISKVLKNIPCHLLNQVVDNDIYYNNKDYVKVYYTLKKSLPKLKNQLMLFNRFAHIYPNYSLLPEARFLYWNINHKQMLINQYEKLNDKESNKKSKVVKVFKRKDPNRTTFFNFSVLKEIFNTSIFNEIFQLSNKLNSKANDEGDDMLFLINEIEKIEKMQLRQDMISKPKLENNISGFWINDPKKYNHSQSKAKKHLFINDSSNPSKYSTLQKPKATQINIKLQSINVSYLNKTSLQTSFNNQPQAKFPYYKQNVVTVGNTHNRSSIRKAILTNQSVSSRSVNNKKKKIKANLITSIPLLTSTSKSPRFITKNNSLLNHQKPIVNHQTANTSRVTTIPSLTEALKLKIPLTNLKLNPKVLSKIKLKIQKQKG